MSFDQKTSEHLQSYVYALIDPDEEKPFYIGKGKRNRVFDHVACALDDPTVNDKYEKIREIISRGKEVNHIIIRLGMPDKIALEVESALIDFANYFKINLTNKVVGHHAIDSGLMSTDEVIRSYNAEPLKVLSDPVIIININKTYERGTGGEGIYKATKESWVIAERRRKQVKLALSEYRGLIVEVYEIEDWYKVETKDKNNNLKIRWGFNGKLAEKSVRDRYISKSVAHAKKQGSSNPIRYKI